MLKGLNELRTAIGIAGIVHRIDTQKDIAGSQRFCPAEGTAQEDGVAGGHIGDRNPRLDLIDQIVFGNGDIASERGAAEGAEVKAKRYVPFDAHRGGDPRGCFEFHLVALAVVKGEGVASEPFPIRDGKAGGGIEPSA